MESSTFRRKWDAIQRAFDEHPEFGLFVTFANTPSQRTHGIRIRRVYRSQEKAPQTWLWDHGGMPDDLYQEFIDYMRAIIDEEINARWGLTQTSPF